MNNKKEGKAEEKKSKALEETEVQKKEETKEAKEIKSSKKNGSTSTTNLLPNKEKSISPILEKIKLDNIEIEKYVICTVLSISSCVIKITSDQNIGLYQCVLVGEKIIGYITSKSLIEATVVLLTPCHNISIYQEVYVAEQELFVKFTKDMFCQMVDWSGKTIGSPYLKQNDEVEIIECFKPAVQLVERKNLEKQLNTGSNIIDFLYPIGHGQRMMLIGDKCSYKTTTALSMVKTICSNYFLYGIKTIIIYVSIGQTKSDAQYTFKKLNDTKYPFFIMFCASSGEMPGDQLVLPMSAMSVADKLSRQGERILIIFDDLSKHALAHREISLLSGVMPSRESYSSDIFYLHAELLEKSSQLESGGSVTCIPIVETVFEELSGFIPTNIISITDGQIFQSKELISQDIHSPVSIKYSITRVGSKIQNNIFKRLVSFCKKTLKSYYDVIGFYNMYAENCAESILDKIRIGSYVIAILYNDNFDSSCSIGKQLVYAVILENKILSKSFSIEQINDGVLATSLKQLVRKTINLLNEKDTFVNKIRREEYDDELETMILACVLQCIDNEEDAESSLPNIIN